MLDRETFYRECLDTFLIDNPEYKGKEEDIEPTFYVNGVALQAWEEGKGYTVLAEYDIDESFEMQMQGRGV